MLHELTAQALAEGARARGARGAPADARGRVPRRSTEDGATSEALRPPAARASSCSSGAAARPAFFIFVFPLLLFVLLGSVYSGKDRRRAGGAVVPARRASSATACANTAFAGLAITLVIRRESGILKRLRATPLPRATYLAAVLASTLIVFALEAVALFVLGRSLFGTPFPTRLVSLVLAVVLGAAAFAALGIALASLIRSAEGSSAVVNVILLPMAFLSGLVRPDAALPGVPARRSPTCCRSKYFIRLMRDVVLVDHTIWSSRAPIAVVAAWGARRPRRRACAVPLGAARGLGSGTWLGKGPVDVSRLLAFPVRAARAPGLEIRVNFGIFAGREATSAEIEELARRCCRRSARSQISSESALRDRPRQPRREVHQVRDRSAEREAAGRRLRDRRARGQAGRDRRALGDARASPSATPRSPSCSASFAPRPARAARSAKLVIARPIFCASRDDRVERGREPVDVLLGDVSGGRPLTMFTLWPATWLRMRWSVKSGTTTSWAKSPGCIRSSMRHVVRPDVGLAELDRPHQPEPAHLLHDLVLVDERPRALEQQLAEPRRRARRDRWSSSSRSVARPATIARSFGANVEPWRTRARASRRPPRGRRRDISSAPTGT